LAQARSECCRPGLAQPCVTPDEVPVIDLVEAAKDPTWW
jgi:hypothetical protein